MKLRRQMLATLVASAILGLTVTCPRAETVKNSRLAAVQTQAASQYANACTLAFSVSLDLADSNLCD